MKVALLISGQPRFVRGEGYRSIKEKILDKYDCDVFCHFWWDPSGKGTYVTAPWSGLGNMPIPTNAEADIKELYSPKKIQWDLPLDPIGMKKYDRTFHPSSSYNLPSMYLSMKKSYELMEAYIKETGQKYDWVVRLRYDAIFTGFPDLFKLDSKILYAPNYQRFHSNLGNNSLIFGPEVAEKVMKIYDQIPLLYNLGVVLNDEQMLTALVNLRKIPYKMLPNDEFYVELCRTDN